MTMRHLVITLLLLIVVHDTRAQRPAITVGSKAFTEGIILGEIIAQTATAAGATVEHRSGLGGTQILWKALERGEIDAYAEYTGTIAEEIFAGRVTADEGALRTALEARGVRMTRPLGFNNTYALGMLAGRAAELHTASISDLSRHSALRVGLSNEFLDRRDGWPGLRDRYGLGALTPRGLDHDLAYRALAQKEIDVVDLYSTDAEIAQYGLTVLQDDRGYFPRYEAVILYRASLDSTAPAAVDALSALAGTIDEKEMIAMNAAVKTGRRTESAAAAAHIASHSGAAATQRAAAPRAEPTVGASIARRTVEHLTLVGLSLLAAIAVGVPLGVLSSRRPRLGQLVLGATSVIYTIPSLALLVVMIPLLGIGTLPVLVALFLYSLLPIVRNTVTGLVGISPPLVESAMALGLSSSARLRRVELPLALPMILAGVKTAAVMNVATATIGALIGAGGYGQPILTGIRLDDMGLILQGAVPAAVMALLVQGLFELLERVVVPRGLRRSA